MNRKTNSPYAKNNQKETNYDVSAAFVDRVNTSNAQSNKRTSQDTTETYQETKRLTSSSVMNPIATPPKSLKPVKDPMVMLCSSPSVLSPSKEKNGQHVVTIVRKLNNDAMLVAVEGQGAYIWQNYFNRSFGPNQRRMMDPCGDGLEEIPIRGKLVKAMALDSSIVNAYYKDKVMPTSSKDVFKDIKQNASYIVSSTGKEEGNTKVWIFTLLQYMELVGADLVYQFEDNVCNVILDFFNKARRPAKKDIGPNSLVNFPDDISYEDAIRIYTDGSRFSVDVKEFILDTDDKVDFFTALAVNAFGQGAY